MVTSEHKMNPIASLLLIQYKHTKKNTHTHTKTNECYSQLLSLLLKLAIVIEGDGED